MITTPRATGPGSDIPEIPPPPTPAPKPPPAVVERLARRHGIEVPA